MLMEWNVLNLKELIFLFDDCDTCWQAGRWMLVAEFSAGLSHPDVVTWKPEAKN